MRTRGSNLSIVKKHNVMLIKEIIYREGPITRADISRSLGLTIPTITTSVNSMLTSGVLLEYARGQKEDAKLMGRPPTVLEINAGAFFVLGIELGPYATSYVITDLKGTVLYSEKKEPFPDDYQSLLRILGQDIPAILETANISPARFLGIGIGLPGFVDGYTGKAQNTFRKDWNGKNLAADLSERLAFPIKVENNVRARALCADLFDQAVVKDPFAFFFVSYGLACPLIIDGTVLYGEAAGAGEIGHMVVEPNGPRCDTCGNYGCLEALASERAIVKRCRQMMTAGIHTMLPQLCADPEKLTMTDILLAQQCGDITINSVIAESIRYLGLNLANIINLVSPRTVLIDGFIFSYPPNRDAMLAVVQPNIFSSKNRKLEIEFVPYNPFLGARGAAAIAVKEFFLNNGELHIP